MPQADSHDVALLFALETELPTLRRKLQLAQVIAEHPLSTGSRNPVLNFAFNNCTVAQIENRVLRLSEAVDVLDRASMAVLGPTIFTGTGRSRRPVDDDFHLLQRVRHERIGHRVKLSHLRDPAWQEVLTRFGTVFRFLFTVMDKIEAHLARLVEAGLYDGHDDLQAPSIEVEGFDESEVSRLIEAANAAADGSSQSPETA